MRGRQHNPGRQATAGRTAAGNPAERRRKRTPSRTHPERQCKEAERGGENGNAVIQKEAGRNEIQRQQVRGKTQATAATAGALKRVQ